MLNITSLINGIFIQHCTRRSSSQFVFGVLHKQLTISRSSRSINKMGSHESEPSLVGTSLVKFIADFTSEKLVKFVDPLKLLDELELKLKDSESLVPKNYEACKDIASFVLNHCVNTSHPLFVNQLYGGPHPVGVAGAFLVEKMNTNAHTYEAAPVFVVAEKIMLSRLRNLFYGNEAGDGVFAPGGSFANFYAATAARHYRFPELKETGLFGIPPLVIFTSEDAHYSITKVANWMGIGTKNVFKIKTNHRGQMIPEFLHEGIRQCKLDGKIPLMVNATAGTTVLGAFDDLDAIAKICADEDVWLHCDAAWGGSFIFSEKLRSENLKGIEKCHSIAWNGHKMLGVPLQCSVFITKHVNILSSCNALYAAYLFQPDKPYAIEFDRTGDKSFQCGRKADAFKLWFMWATLGVSEFRRLVEQAEAAAQYFTKKISGRKDFSVFLETSQCTNVFFWYIPPRLQDKARDLDWWNEVSRIAIKIKEKMVSEGTMLLGYAPLPHKGVPSAFRLVLPAYPPKTSGHMDQVHDLIIQYGENL